MFIFSAGLGTNISADAYYTVERLKIEFAATERYEVEGQNSWRATLFPATVIYWIPFCTTFDKKSFYFQLVFAQTV